MKSPQDESAAIRHRMTPLLAGTYQLALRHPSHKKNSPSTGSHQIPPKGCFSSHYISFILSPSEYTLPQSSPTFPYAVGFAGLGSLSTMTFIRLSVHLIGSANLASPITASLASSAGFSTPPRTSSTTAYL